MHKMFRLLVCSVVSFAGFAGCGTGFAELGGGVGLQFWARTEQALGGSFSDGARIVAFESGHEKTHETFATIELHDKRFELRGNQATVDVFFEGYGNNLSAGDVSFLSLFGQSLQQELSKAASRPPWEHERVMLQFADYLAHSPSRYQHVTADPMTYAASSRRSKDRHGVFCLVRGKDYLASWDSLSGANESEMLPAGSNWPGGYKCMGRCGSGCGKWLPDAWTQDCLDHDVCSFHNASTGGLSDSNCGDEFRLAMDDWVFGVWKGCNGREPR